MEILPLGGLASHLCAQVAIGVVGAMLIVRPEDVEPKFFRLNGLIAAVLGIASALLTQWIGADRMSFVVLILFSLLLAVYSATVVSLPRGIERALLGIAVVLGALFIFGPLRQHTPIRWHTLGDATSMFLGGLIMGAAVVAMNVGHWYLSASQLSIRPLRRTTSWLALLLIVRTTLLLAATVILYRGNADLATWILPQVRVDPIFIVSVSTMRVLFGILGPLLLAYMAWETTKIRSTQSTTGILFALLAMVLVGEGTALYVSSITILPA
ncbi:MAG TPA: hypothetical protein VI895_12080 [Bdellovibrionota bacterium]|nr:hypothetical protein [Bdellovibrionota bacterium]